MIPYEEVKRLVEESEMLQDVQAYDEARRSLAAGEELVPAEVTYAILDGTHPIRAWHEHRGLTQHRVADAAGISVPYLSQIESGQRQGSTEVLAAVARALGLALDDILSS